MGEERDKLVSDVMENATTVKDLLERIQKAQSTLKYALESDRIEIYKKGHFSAINDDNGQIFENAREAISISLQNEILLCQNNLIRLFGKNIYVKNE